ncbi:hypothetical protein P171DRAFT_436959 [Karstenula rhodostoma CBS 690.94]|uniref:DUF4211 domain-containing protein n=1 Tax=Karstenula rhodostoma CBS 690.94 TaxID=1392251 RepID=A0A9P4U5W3_9PLEO|nr:hypothetical protein P171DRAFT_436959 [Karstenula rhodostoma CBS 690.94]
MPPKRSLARTRQSKLHFSPASNASPRPSKSTFVVSSDSDDGPSPSRPAKRQRLEQETERGMKLGMPVSQNKRGMFGSSDNEALISSGSSSETSEGYSEALAAPSPKKAKKDTKKARKVVISDAGPEIRPKDKKRRAARKASQSVEDPSKQGTEGEVTVVRRKDKRTRNKASESSQEKEMVRPKRKARGTARPASKTSESESEGEVTVVQRKSAQRRTKPSADLEEGKTSRSKKASRHAKQPAPAPAALSEDDKDEDEVPTTPRKLTRRRKKAADELSEDEVPRTAQRGRRAKQRDSSAEDSDAEEQNEDSDAEADELKEELAFLQSSPLGLGSTQNKAKSAREKALEAMKRRRAVNSDPPSSSAARKKPVVVDSDSGSDSDLEVIPEASEEDSNGEQGSDESEGEEYGTTAQEVLYGNDEDEGFINDDDAPIGVPAEHALPLHFSSLSNSKPRDLFKYAIDWMVQKKINPAFNSEDEIYEMSFRKLDDEVNGLAGSKYHSSVWTAEFTRAIKARPEIVINDIDPRTRAVMEPHCEACNRRSHPATFELSFTGQPYQKETLEPLAVNASDSDSESDSDSSAVSSTGSEEALNGEKPTYDAQGERIPPESKAFTLGSTCKANAQVAHTLYHWRYHLNSWVVDYLVRQGHCTPEELVRRDKLSQRKRQKIANKIADEMDTNGEIKKLYRMYKDQVNFALEAENEYRKGWGRRG